MTATTRRALFGAGIAIAAAAVPAAASTPLSDDQVKLAAHLQSVWGEQGLDVAVGVISAGFGYEDLECSARSGRAYEKRVLTVYVTDGKQTRAFTAEGERQATLAA